MKKIIKASAFTFLLLSSITSYAEEIELEEIGSETIGSVDLSVSQQDIAFTNFGSTVGLELGRGGIITGTLRNVATLELSEFSDLRETLFGDGITTIIRINDRSLVPVALKFEEGEEEITIGRATPSTQTDLIVLDQQEPRVLRGRVRAIYDESEDQLTVRYIERIEVEEGGSLFNPARFDVTMGVVFSDSASSSIPLRTIRRSNATTIIATGSVPVVEIDEVDEIGGLIGIAF